MAKKKESGFIIEAFKKLKKFGFVNIDLRKVTPKTLDQPKERKRLLAVLNRNKDAINFLTKVDESKGKVSKLKNKTDLVALESRGYKVDQKTGLVFIDSKKDEKITVTSRGNLKFSRQVRDRKSGKVKTEVIYEPNIDLNKIQSFDDAVKIYEQMFRGTKDSQIAFTYYGNISKQRFASIKDALLKINSYVQKQNDIDLTQNPADIPEVMKAVQFITYHGVDDVDEFGSARVNVQEKKDPFNKYFKKLNAKRGK